MILSNVHFVEMMIVFSMENFVNLIQKTGIMEWDPTFFKSNFVNLICSNLLKKILKLILGLII